VFGVLLLVVGGLLLVGRLAEVQLENAWPLWIILPGLAMLIASFAVPPRGGLGLAVPGAVIATIGAILWVQDTYDAWQTWAYAWALVGPTAPGVGTLLYGLVKGDRELVRDGSRATVTGLALFAGFALFFEGVLGLSGDPIANLDDVLPFAIIGLGVLLLVVSLFGGGRRRERRAR
jgi:peptidoglycan/LPS O-acetylase OafA/YrhL